MRIQVVAASVGTALLLSLAGGAARAQVIHVVRPAHGAIVRETVPIKVAASDLPADGYVSIYIDDQFRIAQTLPKNPDAPVFVWETKGTNLNGSDTVRDGDHTIKIELYTATSKLLGSDTVPVRVANQITPPSPALKLTYRWTAQPRLTFHRVSEIKVPSTQPGATVDPSVVPGTSVAGADEVLQESDLGFVRSTENATDAKTLLRDIIVSGLVTDHGQSQPILKSYNVQPRRRTVDARGVVLSSESNDDLMDHIGFPVPELPARRVGKGDRWLEPAIVALNWDGSTLASVTAECSLEGFEWQNNYPTAKIRETYSGPAHFTSRPVTASGHAPLTPFSASAITYDRVLYFAYGSGRLIKDTTSTQITLTPAQLSLLGGTTPSSGSAGDSAGGATPYGAPQYPGAGYPGPAASLPTSVTLDVSDTTTLQTP